MESCVTFTLRYGSIQVPPNMQNFLYNMASLCIVLLLLTVKTALSAKILGYSAFGSGSHYHIVSNPLLELALRGHEVLI